MYQSLIENCVSIRFAQSISDAPETTLDLSSAPQIMSKMEKNVISEVEKIGSSWLVNVTPS